MDLSEAKEAGLVVDEEIVRVGELPDAEKLAAFVEAGQVHREIAELEAKRSAIAKEIAAAWKRVEALIARQRGEVRIPVVRAPKPRAAALETYDLYPQEHAVWIERCLVWVETCDVLLRLPGDSPGSDLEVAYMYSLSRPCFDAVTGVVQWAHCGEAPRSNP